MKKFFTAFILFAFYLTQIFAQRSNCSVSPYPCTFTQADGSKITLYAKGNEAVHYTETADGYTVLKNNNDVYEYAIIGMDGNLTLSGVKASDDQSVLGKTGMQKHLRYSAQQVSVLQQYFESLSEPQIMGKAGANVFPPTGNKKVLVILMEFPDLRASVPKSNFDLMFNQTNYNGTGSFKDYYLRTTYGALNLTVDVVGWFMAPNGYKTYKSATTTLLKRAADCADSAGTNFANYDSDNDGYVDAVMVMHAGLGAEESSAPNSADYIWSFRSTWGSSPLYDNKRVYAFAMFPEKRFYSSAMVGIGVMSHEFGHILDLPDLYATNYNGAGGGPEGVGNYANMAGGPWLNNEHTPCMHDAFSKILLGWLTPVVINSAGTYTIPKASVDSNFAFRINTTRSNEYFLLENRQKKGQDLFLPSKGLAIWHANTSMAGKLSTNGNNANNDTSNQGLGILQADGKRDLELGVNRGDAGDLYPGYTNNSNATQTSNPNTNLYYKVGGVRQQSGIFITNITVNPDSSVTFKFGAIPNASYVSSTSTGCAPLNVSFTNYSIFARSYIWNFGDGTYSNNANQTHTFTNPGNYAVWLNIYDSSGNVLDSTSQTIVVSPKPVALASYTRSGNVVTFTNNSTGAIAYSWQFSSFTSSDIVLAPLNLKDVQDTGIVHIQLIAVNSAGCTDTTILSVDIWKTGIAQNQNQYINANLYPNPISENSVLQFTTQSNEKIAIEIFNMLGEKIATIDNQELQSGKHQYEISKNILPSKGIYLIRINAEDHHSLIRLLNP